MWQRQGASTQSYNALIQKTLGEIDGKLISTLEQYFDTSFRVQNDASSCLQPLLQTRTEMKLKFGLNWVTPVSVGSTPKNPGMLDLARKNDPELVELLRELRDTSDSYSKLDQTLMEAHPDMWRAFLEALNKVRFTFLVFARSRIKAELVLLSLAGRA